MSDTENRDESGSLETGAFDGDVKPPVIPAPILPNTALEETEAPTSYPSFLKEPPLSAEEPFSPSEPVVPTPEFSKNKGEETISKSGNENDGSNFSVEAPVIPSPSPELTENEPLETLPTEELSDSGIDTPVAPPIVPPPTPELSEAEQSDLSEYKESLVADMPAAPPVIPPPPLNLAESDTPETVTVAEPTNTKADTLSSAQPPVIPAVPEATSEEQNNETLTETPINQEATTETQSDVDYRSENFMSDLFANNNECVTAPGGSFPVKDDTRSLLALFTNGRFFVSEEARFDGKVLGFEYLAKKRRFQIGEPEHVPSVVIRDIYEYAAQNTTKGFIPTSAETNLQEQVRMQRDFVTIVSRAAMNHVSDIHIVVAEHTTVMFRVNGLMQTEMEYNKEWGESFVRAAFASADISDANYAQNEYQAAQKLGRTPLRGSGGQLNLPRNVLGIRLQFNPIAFGSRYVVMRLLYAEEDSNASNLAALGFSQREMDIFYQIRSIPTGIVIISGPTGSGKSTTLQRNMIAMLQERNYEFNLITVEDPPEYPIPGARQMPVTNAMIEEAKDREFTKALSAALRSDPDSLMIGEIRTLAAADLAFRGALSGHNVWTTLHTNSAPAVVMRLKDIGVEDFKLQDPSIMKALVAQRLFRKLCPHCRLKASQCLDNPAVQRLRKALGDVALEQCYIRGSGCEACDMRGVNGRTVIGEFLLPDSTFLDLSVRGEFNKALNYWINDLGGITLREAAITRMLDGTVDVEEVERWTGLLDHPVLA